MISTNQKYEIMDENKIFFRYRFLYYTLWYPCHAKRKHMKLRCIPIKRLLIYKLNETLITIERKLREIAFSFIDYSKPARKIQIKGLQIGLKNAVEATTKLNEELIFYTRVKYSIDSKTFSLSSSFA